MRARKGSVEDLPDSLTLLAPRSFGEYTTLLDEVREYHDGNNIVPHTIVPILR